MGTRTQHGTITKRSGSWVGHYSQWSPNPDDPKKPHRHQHAFRIGLCTQMTKAEARSILADRIKDELHLRADRRVTVGWFIDSRWLPLRQSSWRDSTRTTNLYLLGLIKEKFGTVPLEDVEDVLLQGWVDELAKTRSRDLCLHIRIYLMSIFEKAVYDDYLRKSPAHELHIPANLRPVTKIVLSVEQIRALMNHAQGVRSEHGTPDRVLLGVAFCTALRPSELLALQWKHFNATEQRLRIVQSVHEGKLRDFTKTTTAESSATLTQVFLSESVAAALSQWRTQTKYPDDSDFIFAAQGYGDTQWRAQVVKRLRAYGTAVGIPRLTFQAIRTTVATLLDDGQGSAKDIQTVLRHKKPDTAALHYTQAQESSVRAAVDRLDRLLTR